MTHPTLRFFIFIFISVVISISAKPIATGVASITYYHSYPACCHDAPNYDPMESTGECADYSGCTYMGMLSGYITDCNINGFVPFEFVRRNNLIAFYDNSDPGSSTWGSKYALRTVVLSKSFNGKNYKFNATIADTCHNTDCGNCCAINAGATGFLVDMEYYTVMNNFGATAAADGTINFAVY